MLKIYDGQYAAILVSKRNQIPTVKELVRSLHPQEGDKITALVGEMSVFPILQKVNGLSDVDVDGLIIQAWGKGLYCTAVVSTSPSVKDSLHPFITERAEFGYEQEYIA